MNTQKKIKNRIVFVFIVITAMLVTVLVRTFSIQADKVSTIFTSEDGRIPMRIALRPTRVGDILDINGTPLVTSVSKFDIYMDPTVPKQADFDKLLPGLCQGLHQIFPDIRAGEMEIRIRRARGNNSRYLLIRKKVTNAERKKISELPLFNLGRFKGGFIDSQEESIRKRPHGEMMKRTLGYYRAKDKRHPELRVGIEGAYYDYLRGEPGQEIEQHLTTGWKKTGKIVKDAVEGASVVTSIETEIQEVAHNELYKQLVKTNAISGSVIVMDVKTGFIKAISNLNRASDSSYHESYNNAIGIKEVPGSTFKLASLMAALEDGRVSLDDTVQAAPVYSFYNVKLTEAEGHDYGKLTVKQAFEKSSNVFSKIIFNAYRNDPMQFINRLKSFGLDLPIGIDLEGEPTPTLYQPGDKHWWAGELAWLGVGYDVQLTPLQLLTFYNAVANDGKKMKPQFVKEIRRGNKVEKVFQPIVLQKSICSKSTLEKLQECLHGVVQEGTGRHLKSAYFSIAGKTGTAAVLNDNNKYGDKKNSRYLASFIGYFPVEDPIYSCIVSVTANGDNIYGASVSGSVFSAIANKVYASRLKYHHAVNEQSDSVLYANLPAIKVGNVKEIATILKTLNIPYHLNNNDEWVVSEPFQSKISLHKRLVGNNLVPNVSGMTAKDAVFLLESAGLIVDIDGYGTVRNQSIKAGEPLDRYIGSKIILTLR